MIRSGRVLTALALVGLTAGLLISSAEAKPPRGGIGRPGLGTANPSALVATEIAFGRLAAQKGQWKAYREFADESAVLLVPRPVPVAEALKGRAEPAKPDARETYRIWMSCDGTLGVTQGALRKGDGSLGAFVTVWKRQKNGTYRWVMDQGDPSPLKGEAPDMVAAKVAACDVVAPRPSTDGILVTAPLQRDGISDDGSLAWSIRLDPRCARLVLVRMKRNPGEPLSEVFAERIAASPGETPKTCGA